MQKQTCLTLAGFLHFGNAYMQARVMHPQEKEMDAHTRVATTDDIGSSNNSPKIQIFGLFFYVQELRVNLGKC